MNHFLRWVMLLALLLPFPSAASAGVIVNPSVEDRSIGVATLRNILTLRQAVWPDRRPIVVFVLPDNNPVHEALAKEKLGLYHFGRPGPVHVALALPAG